MESIFKEPINANKGLLRV